MCGIIEVTAIIVGTKQVSTPLTGVGSRRAWSRCLVKYSFQRGRAVYAFGSYDNIISANCQYRNLSQLSFSDWMVSAVSFTFSLNCRAETLSYTAAQKTTQTTGTADRSRSLRQD
jgi:hypothetical protein